MIQIGDHMGSMFKPLQGHILSKTIIELLHKLQLHRLGHHLEEDIKKNIYFKRVKLKVFKLVHLKKDYLIIGIVI